MTEPILSYEFKTVIDYIKNSMLAEFPINTITINYLILAILDCQTCDGFNILSKLMMHSSISDFKGYMSNIVLADCQGDLQLPDTLPKFSDEYDKLAQNISVNGSTVTTALMLKEIVINNIDIANKLNSLGVTVGQLSDTVLAFTTANIIKEEVKPSKKPKKKILQHKDVAVNIQNTFGSRIIPDEANAVEATCENLVRNASKGMYDNLIGYDDIANDIFDVLGKYDRNAVALIGPNGVGKSSIVNILAKKIYNSECPYAFQSKYVMKFNDTINNSIIGEMNRIGKYIAFIDDAEKLFVNKETEMNNLYVLMELFKCQNISTIICMSESAYSKSIESHPEASRYLHKIKIEEADDETLFNIVSHGCHSISLYNNVNFNDAAIRESIRLCHKFITSEKAPKSTLNILDMAGSHARMTISDNDELLQAKKRLADILSEKNNISNSGSSEEFDKKDELIREEINIKKKIEKLQNDENNTTIDISVDDIKYAVSKMSGIPIADMNEDEKAKLKNLYSSLTECVIGQDDTVADICRAVKRQRVGLSNHNKPCVMLFVGSTGTGKSFLAKRLAYEMFGDENNMVRLDMSEYSEKTAVTKLYGASAGYIGYEEGGVLTEAIKKKPRSVLLLDEIEKASDDVYNVFLQVFDEGRLTDNKGTVVDFKNIIIIMTSNVGAKDASDKIARIGFGHYDANEETKDIILKSIKKQFKPEFINRIDNICYFNKLTDDNIRVIIKNEIKKVRKKVVDLGYDLDDEIMNGKLVDSIFDKVKAESEYGARPVIREIQKQLEDKLTDYIIDNDIESGFIFKYDNIY